MHTSLRRLSAVYAGFDERFLFAMLDFSGVAPESGECILQVQATDANGSTITNTQIHVLIEKSAVKRWWLARDDASGIALPVAPADFEEGAARLTQVLELRVQRLALRATPGGSLALRFSLQTGQGAESLPREGWMKLAVLSEEDLVESANKHW